jgi:glutathione S-transferase
MITLYGFAISNYYNKIKLVLLEKDIPFREEHTFPSQDEALLKRSPLGKIPFIETEQGYLSESQAILEYLEEAYPEKPLYPTDPFARARNRELIQHLELNIELIARRLYKEAFFGGSVSDEAKQEVKERVEIGLAGLARLAKFDPYILGSEMSTADLLAWVHFGTIGMAVQKIYGEDLIAKHIPSVATYLALLESRPPVQKVAADRALALEAFFKGK